MFGVVASDYPRLKITPEYAVAMGKALASMYVENNGHEELAFTLALVRITIMIMYQESTLLSQANQMNWGWFKYYKLSIYRAFNVDTYLTPLGQDIQADMKLWFNSSSPMGPYLVCGNVSNPKYNYFFGKNNNMHKHVFFFQSQHEPLQIKHWKF